LKEYLSSLEKDLICQALSDSGGVVARAADRLHIRRTTLVEKIRKYDLPRATGNDEDSVSPAESKAAQSDPIQGDGITT